MSRGTRCAEDVRLWLAANGLKQSQLTALTLAEIIDHRLDEDDRIAKNKRKLVSEEAYLKSLEADPYLAGVNIRQELAACQFWCKNNGCECSKRRFGNWIAKARKDKPLLSGGGTPPPKKADIYTEPPDWKQNGRCRAALGLSPDSWALVVERGWFDLGPDVRKSILQSL
jgi:hypothetical protein